jgi:hypothetical protein
VLTWATISSLATAGGTLVLGVATFAAVRSSNRSARIAEQALMVGLRPLLVASRLQDGDQKVSFGDGRWLHVAGGTAAAESDDGVVYLAISVRNAGRGIGVVHGWHFQPGRHYAEHHPDLQLFRTHVRDMYIPSGDIGFWQGALRDADDPWREGAVKAIDAGDPLTVDVLYGDHEGGQRMVSRFLVTPFEGPDGEQRWLASASRHWNIDRPDPR